MLKSLIVLVLGGSSLLLAYGSGGDDGRRADGPDARALDGAWRLVAYKPAGAEEYARMPGGWEQTKLVVGGRFAWTLVRDAKTIRSVGGRCTTRAGEYTEPIEFVLAPQDEWMIGKTGSFRWKLDGNTWFLDGVVEGDEGESRIEEKWERIE